MNAIPVPIFRVDQRRAADAFACHAAIIKAEIGDPALSKNPQWTIIRQDAFEAFDNAFEVSK